MAHIWEPFFTTKGIGKGTGLGLSTVRGIVENHGGFINLRTEKNKGTAIRVYLPAAEGAVKDRRNRHPADPFVQREQRGTHPDCGSTRPISGILPPPRSATTAIASFLPMTGRKGAPQARQRWAMKSGWLLTDSGMPKLDGSTLASVVNALSPNIKIVAMSGAASREKEAQAAGFADAFLVKPFKTEDLLRTVHALLEPAAAGPSHK